MDVDDPTADDDIAFGPEPDRFLRATIAGGRITLNPPLAGTITGGAASMTLARLRGVVLVDLRDAGREREELVATVPPNAPPVTRAAQRVLCEWAALVGYRRVWLADRVVELEPPASVGRAEVRCPTCGSVWADGSPGFWAMVRSNGHFPGYCPACGGSLPEWRPAPAASWRVAARSCAAPAQPARSRTEM